MDLQGKTVGQYQIVAELGRGGMAVVYKAWQPSLERFVALKVLPAYFQHEPEFLARFHREAKAAARLSHPNIIVIHDIGEAGGVHYIAMEYVDGGSLRERLTGGRLSLSEAERVLSQVASALDYAHSHGLVHRDIKPANILFTASGEAKVTDFGIAQASDGTRLTRTGALMGTPEYMAPEQAEGRPVDHRTDLYALGVVLYQMLTGQAPFRATTPHATLHAVIYEPPPPPHTLNPELPHAVEKVVLKAIAKQPEQRFRRGSEMVAALRAAAAGRAPKVAIPVPRPAQRRSPLVWILGGIAAALVLILGGLALLLRSSGGTAIPTPATTQVAWQTPTTAPTAQPPTATLIPPASEVAPTGTPPPSTPTPPAPTDTPPAPTATALPPTATPPPPTDTPLPPTDTPIPPTPVPSGPSGRLAFTSNRFGNPEIYVVNLPSGSPQRLTNNSANDWLPDWSPDGKRIAFTSNRNGGYDLWVMNADGSGATAVVATDAWDDYARWAPDGQRLAFSTTALTQGVANSEIHVRLADGRLVQRTSSTAEDQWPDWSPDGRIVFTEGFKGGSGWDIYVMNADGSNRALWLGGPACDVKPAWSPDGNWIAFIRNSRDTNGNGAVDEEDAGDVWVARADGSDLRQLTSGDWAITPAWSPDSRWIAFARLRDSNGNGRSDGEDAADIVALARDDGEVVALVQSAHRDADPSWTQ
jgi:serine/threonine protein kinase